MDGEWMGRWMDKGWMDGWMDRRIDRWIKDGWTGGWMDGWIDRWMDNGWMDRPKERQKDGRKDVARRDFSHSTGTNISFPTACIGFYVASGSDQGTGTCQPI